MIVTEKHRDAAKQEIVQERERNKMSAAAAAKLRQINEHTKLNKEANAVLVKWFDEQPKTVELLMDLTHLIRPADVLNIRKRAVKCLAMLTRGLKVNEIHDILFFGELLQEEEKMSLSQILNRYPISNEPLITPIVLSEVKLCANQHCRKGEGKTKGIVPKGSRGGFCSKECRWAANVPKSPKKAIPTVQNSEQVYAEPA